MEINIEDYEFIKLNPSPPQQSAGANYDYDSVDIEEMLETLDIETNTKLLEESK